MAKQAGVSSKSDLFAGFEFVKEVPTALKTPAKSADPVQDRRKKMLEGIEHQKKLWQNPEYTFTKKVFKKGEKGKDANIAPKAWWSQAPDGDIIYLSPRYGVRPLEIKPEMPVVKLTKGQVVPFLGALAQAVEAGQFDDQLAKLATRSDKAQGAVAAQEPKAA